MPIARMRECAALRAEGDASLRARMELLTEHRDRLRAQLAVLRGHERGLRAKVETYAQMLADVELNEGMVNNDD